MLEHRLRKYVFFTIMQVVLLGMVPFMGCSSQEVNKEDPEALFQAAEDAFKDERYLSALEKYRDIKNRFPYSNRAVDSELRVADTLYEQENFIEAESAYEIFKELHPTHSKGDYVQFRIAMSYYRQIPDNATRDLSAAYKAIEAFTILQQKYPNSEFVSKATEAIQTSRKRLAEHENYVADFYYQRQHYLSASYRYSTLLQDYPNLGYDEQALYRLAESYFQVKMYSNAEDAVRRLLARFPESQFKGDAEGLLAKMREKKE